MKFKPSKEEIEILKNFKESIDNDIDLPKVNKKAFEILRKIMPKFENDNEGPKTLSSVLPLFKIENRNIIQYASGVLIEFFDKLYLLTALHAIKNEKPLIPVNHEIIPLEGICRGVDCNKQGNVCLDFAYVEINESLSKGLRNDFYILGVDDLLSFKDFEVTDSCVFTGYPYRKSKKRDNHIETELFEYVATYTNRNELYRSSNCSVENNIIARFNFKQGTTRFGDDVKNVVHPEGISGGAIFLRDIRSIVIGDENESEKLIGIGHSFDLSRRVLIGTKIDTCLHFMASHDIRLQSILSELVLDN